MPRREHVDLLLRKAAQDELALDILLQHEATPTEVLGFHAQQATEKLLKAVLAATVAEYPHTHRIDRLMELLRAAGREVPPALRELRRLTPFAGELRYEMADDDGPLDLDAERTRQDLRDLRGWVEERLER